MLLFCPTCGRLVTLEEGFKRFNFVCDVCKFKMPVCGEVSWIPSEGFMSSR